MTDKVFNLFHEYAARCVHLFPQEEEYTSFWEDSKIWHLAVKSVSKIWQHSKFTEDANWNKQKSHYSQNWDLSGKWYCQTLKAFRIFSCEMKILLFIQSWDVLVLCIFRQ